MAGVGTPTFQFEPNVRLPLPDGIQMAQVDANSTYKIVDRWWTEEPVVKYVLTLNDGRMFVHESGEWSEL